MTTEASFFGLTDKKATVIGGGQGMGESTSRFLARAGCDEAVIDIERERAERVAGAVGELGRRGVPIIGDVLDDTQIPTIVASVEQQLGGIDVMVSIVGAAVWDPCWTRPGDLGPAVASQPALFLPLRTGSGGNDDQARQSGRDRGHRLGGRTAIEPDARRVRCSEGGADQPRAVFTTHQSGPRPTRTACSPCGGVE